MKMKVPAALMLVLVGVAFLNSPAQADSGNYPPSKAAQPYKPSSAALARKAARQSNRRLERNVRSAIAKPGGVDVSRLTVVARSGTVTLAGSVPEEAQIQTANDRAEAVKGVSTVRNELTIAVLGGH
jgi:osmotically-inducible protein OsmY